MLPIGSGHLVSGRRLRLMQRLCECHQKHCQSHDACRTKLQRLPKHVETLNTGRGLAPRAEATPPGSSHSGALPTLRPRVLARIPQARHISVAVVQALTAALHVFHVHKLCVRLHGNTIDCSPLRWFSGRGTWTHLLKYELETSRSRAASVLRFCTY